MNIYLIIEDGEQFCIRAKTPQEAIGICLNSYLEDIKKDTENMNQLYSEEHETKFYYDNILLSVQLIGGLRN